MRNARGKLDQVERSSNIDTSNALPISELIIIANLLTPHSYFHSTIEETLAAVAHLVAKRKTRE